MLAPAQAICHYTIMSEKRMMAAKPVTKKPAAKQLVAVPRAAQKPTHASRAKIRRAVKAVLSMRQQANA
jgi:hypothetical protein